MSSQANAVAARAAIMRWLGFLCLWLVVSGTGVVDLLVGAATTAAAAWASLRLLPPATRRPRPAALARLVARFFWQSAVAGADVARRALDPGLPLRPGFVRCPMRLAPGSVRSAFCAFSSLLPGRPPAAGRMWNEIPTGPRRSEGSSSWVDLQICQRAGRLVLLA